MAPSIHFLSCYLRSLNFSNAGPVQDLENTLPWINGSQILAVFSYVIKFCSNSDHDQVSDTIQRLDILSSDCVCEKGTENRIRFSEMVDSLMPQLETFFMVPKKCDNIHKENEVVAAFIDFLCQILDCGTDLFVSVQDQIVPLREELKFLVTVLGDTPFLCCEIREVKNILEEFEDVANEAGSFIYSCIFATNGITYSIMEADLRVLLGKMDLLNVKIKDHCIEFAKMPNFIIPRTAVESLFIVDSLLDDLENILSLKVDLIYDVRDLIKTTHEELIGLKFLLKVVNVSKLVETEQLKESLAQIRELSYETEYLISSFMVEDIPVWYLVHQLPDVAHKIKLMRTRLNEIKKKEDIGVLKAAEDLVVTKSLQVKRSPVVDNIVVGFEEDKTTILDQLVGGAEHLQTISIFGMPGLGKTTLAMKLYNDLSVVYHFDRRSWCVVSQMYQRKNIFIQILTSLNTELDKETILKMDVEELAEHIYRSLKGRRYLIVMDDMWNLNAWDELKRYFPDDKNGSRIVFTSRIKDVAPPDSIIHPLPFLSHSECWNLLQQKVFKGDPYPPDLIDVGMRIAEHCSGLPLAVVVTAGILANVEKEESVWKTVEGSLGSYIFGDSSECMKILELSYKHLPDRLKPCFLYFGAFSEDAEIPVSKLKQLWIAEGFIQKEENKSLESVAEEYLMDLIDRSLVLVTRNRSDGGIKACRIHDLLRDLCLRKAQAQNFLNLITDVWSLYEHHHRTCVVSSLSTSTMSRPFGLHIRTFLGPLTDTFYCLQNMKFLRILDLSTIRLYEFHLDRIGLLIHLRYLCLTCLPTSVGSLLNLQFLRVENYGFNYPVYIRPMLWNILKLKHLQVTGDAIFIDDDDSFHINNLQFLSGVFIGDLQDEEILRCSPQIRKLKCTCCSLWVAESTYRYPDFQFLTQLESLKIDFRSDFGHLDTIFNFPSTLKKLSLSKFLLPWEKMSLFGKLPNLEVLKLGYDAFCGERWKTRTDEFQKLKFLKLDGLTLARWSTSSEHFPTLQRLVLRNCFKLMKIPSELGDIPTLQTIEVHSCSVNTNKSALEIKEEQLENGNEELKLIIT